LVAAQSPTVKAGRSNRKNDKRKEMDKYICNLCGYVYDPEVGDPDNGVDAGTAFADLPEEWVCPDCGAGVDVFEPTD